MAGGARHPRTSLLSLAAMRRSAFVPGVGAATAALVLAAPASAATYIVNVNNAMDLGTVVAAATGPTVFRVNPSTGAVTVVSGGGRRLSTGSARVMVTVSCQPGRGSGGGQDNGCAQSNVRMRVGTIGALIGRAAALQAFTVTMGTATLVGGVTGSDPAAFQIAPIGNNGSKTFFVGADF